MKVQVESFAIFVCNFKLKLSCTAILVSCLILWLGLYEHISTEIVCIPRVVRVLPTCCNELTACRYSDQTTFNAQVDYAGFFFNGKNLLVEFSQCVEFVCHFSVAVSFS